MEWAEIATAAIGFLIAIGLVNGLLWAVGSPWRWWIYRKDKAR